MCVCESVKQQKSNCTQNELMSLPSENEWLAKGICIGSGNRGQTSTQTTLLRALFGDSISSVLLSVCIQFRSGAQVAKAEH